MWETPQLALDHIEEFLTGIHRTAEPRHVLATVLFTDIVNSTQQASRVDLRLRAGLHTGEVELRDNDVGGIDVHIAARVMAAARPGEILSP
jgi:class 3 adenylate cyclase